MGAFIDCRESTLVKSSFVKELKKENVKRQNYFNQIQREKASAVSLVDVESDKGVKLDD